MASTPESRQKDRLAALEAAARVVASRDGNVNKTSTDVTAMASSLLRWLEQ